MNSASCDATTTDYYSMTIVAIKDENKETTFTVQNVKHLKSAHCVNMTLNHNNHGKIIIKLKTKINTKSKIGQLYKQLISRPSWFFFQFQCNWWFFWGNNYIIIIIK